MGQVIKEYKITISKKKINLLHKSSIVKKLHDGRHSLYKKETTLFEQCKKQGMYYYIPMSSRYLLIEFLALKEWIKKQTILKELPIRTKNLKFLDAGSGIGNVLLLANVVKLSTYYTGIKFNKPTCELSKDILNFPKKRFKIILGDIITYEKYNNFDILYYYCPFENPLLEIYFEELLEDNMRLGAILAYHLKKSYRIYNDKRFTKIILNVNNTNTFSFYVKTSNGPRTSSELPQFSKEPYHRLNLSEKYKIKIDKHISKYS